MPALFSVHVISRNPALRDTLRTLLEIRAFACLEHESPADMRRSGYQNNIVCVLADVDSLDEDPVSFLQSVISRDICNQVILMADHLPMAVAVEALRQGAADLLDLPLDQHFLGLAIDRAHERATQGTRFAKLSPRERETLLLLMQGLKNKSVAVRLGISPRTVDIYRSKLMEKLCVRTFAELCSIAIRFMKDVGRDLPPSGAPHLGPEVVSIRS